MVRSFTARAEAPEALIEPDLKTDTGGEVTRSTSRPEFIVQTTRRFPGLRPSKPTSSPVSKQTPERGVGLRRLARPARSLFAWYGGKSNGVRASTAAVRLHRA